MTIVYNADMSFFMILEVKKLKSLPDRDFKTLSKSAREAIISINNMRSIAAENGYMTDEEINAEIEAYRSEKRTECFMM